MNRYEGLDCPVCHNKLSEDDDIVVCPDCGAPHHKKCYISQGHCYFEDKHGTDEQWSMPLREKTIDIDEQESGNADGFKNNNTADYDMQYENVEKNDGQRKRFNPFVFEIKIDKNEEIDGIKTYQLACYVGYNAVRYINIFKKISFSKSITGWNWMGFLIPEYWLLSRKCYKIGALIVFFKLLTASLIYLMGMTPDYFISMTNKSVEEMILFIHSNEFIIFSIITLAALIVNLLIGLLGDYIYKRKVYKSIDNLKAKGSMDEVSLIRAGGVNLFIPLLVWAGWDVVVNFIVTLVK